MSEQNGNTPPPTLDIPKSYLAPLVFDDPAPIQVPVRIRGKDYVLVEADTDTALKYQGVSAKAARWEGNKVVGWDGLQEAQIILLIGCLREVRKDAKDGQGNPVLGRVAEGFVRGLPYSIVKPLFQRARAISPSLTERVADTVESIDAQIHALQRMRKELIDTGEVDTVGKESPGGAEAATGSLTS